MADLDVALRLRADASGLVGEIRLSKQELDRLGREAQRAGGRAGRARRGWAAFGREMEASRRRATALRLAMIALATGGAARVGASFLSAASDAEELRSQFAAVFRELTAEARAWARAHAEAVGRSSLDIEQYLATLQDTFVPLGFARREAFGFSRTLAQLGVDLASFKNAAEPETIDLLTSAIVGNHEAVRRFGIVITESTLKQELMNAGIAGGVQAATEQDKVLARLRIIMRSTADAQGDAARTADQYANRSRAASGEMLGRNRRATPPGPCVVHPPHMAGSDPWGRNAPNGLRPIRASCKPWRAASGNAAPLRTGARTPPRRETPKPQLEVP